MSTQFGRWNFDGKPVDHYYLEKVKASLGPYSPDADSSYSAEDISILYHAFHTTKESRCETQPLITSSGLVITFDGRLDNRADLIRFLGDGLAHDSSDVSLVAAAYGRWGADCFAQLVGDWALSIWEGGPRSLILAKDPIGVRQLHYSFDNYQVTWSTVLDPLVLFANRTFALCEEYLAGWFSFFPATHLTPYVGIHSVPPSTYVTIQAGKCSVKNYWDFDPSKRLRYRTDAEYEEHFRTVFRESVRRRLRSDGPILAELSGGIDSSSIVCMADTVLGRGFEETTRLDTVSYYDDSEPNWNERPFFTMVEEQRGRRGCHIDVSKEQCFTLPFDSDCFAATPISHSSHASEASRGIAACMRSQGNRVVLSGVGGDEVAGGVPTPTPELEDLLARARLIRLARQLKIWALSKRKPWVHLFLDAVLPFLPLVLHGTSGCRVPIPWLDLGFVRRNRNALQGYQDRMKLFGVLPSFQDNLSALAVLRRQLTCSPISATLPHEKRYPYLDRDLLEFLYAIPREQFVRPGQRRSLVRRALVDIVPDEILNRRRKAFVVRTPIASILRGSANLALMSGPMVSVSLGIVSKVGFSAILQQTRLGEEVPIVPLMSTLTIEFWLRSLSNTGILHIPVPGTNASRLAMPSQFSAEKKMKTEGGETYELRKTGSDATGERCSGNPEP